MNNEKVIYKILMISAIVLQIVNIVLLFVPVIEWYQPSYKETSIFGESYGGWKITTASIITLGYTLFIVLLPYIISLVVMIKRFFKTPTKKCKFFFAKLGCICSFIAFYNIYDVVNSGVRVYKEHGAYFNITAGGILNLIVTAVMFLFLIFLSKKTKQIAQRNAPLLETENPQINEAE